MRWQILVICSFTIVACSVGQIIQGVDDSVLSQYFTYPPTESPDDGDEDDGECTCLPFYQCINGTVNEDGVGLLDIRQSKCSNSVHQCCFPKETTTVPTSEPTPLVSKGCGMRNVRGVGFEITGATEGEANFAEFPWVVALMSTESGHNIYKCGGALISYHVVLTAAHCIGKAVTSSWVVRAGEWDTQTVDEYYKYDDRGVQSIIKHEQYMAAELRNDIALMVLDSPFNPSPHIDTICLPQQGQTFDNTRCFATGWGKDRFGQDGLFQNILKSIELPMMPQDKCVRAFRKTRLGPFFKLHSSFVCAGGEKGRDVCRGDGGAPLICPSTNDQNRYVQVGIVAWGIGCGEEGVPGAYGAVAQFRNWIDDQMSNLGFDTESYTSPDE